MNKVRLPSKFTQIFYKQKFPFKCFYVFNSFVISQKLMSFLKVYKFQHQSQAFFFSAFLIRRCHKTKTRRLPNPVENYLLPKITMFFLKQSFQ